jgi:hypothetical protein
METILHALSDPAAWVSNIAFGIATTLIWKLFPMGKRLLVRSFRSSRLKRLRKIREARTNQAAIAFAIGKATAMQAAFLILCFLYILAIVLSEPYRAVLHWSLWAGLALASPVFVFELIWLSYDSFAESLVKESAKLSLHRRKLGAA